VAQAIGRGERDPLDRRRSAERLRDSFVSLISSLMAFRMSCLSIEAERMHGTRVPFRSGPSARLGNGVQQFDVDCGSKQGRQRVRHLADSALNAYRADLDRRLDRLLSPTPPHKAGRKLQKMFKDIRDPLFVFVANRELTATNNGSERACARRPFAEKSSTAFAAKGPPSSTPACAAPSRPADGGSSAPSTPSARPSRAPASSRPLDATAKGGEQLPGPEMNKLHDADNGKRLRASWKLLDGQVLDYVARDDRFRSIRIHRSARMRFMPAISVGVPSSSIQSMTL